MEHVSLIQALREKEHLDAGDASRLLRLLQEQTSPVLSAAARAVPSSPHDDMLMAAHRPCDRNKPLKAEATHLKAAEQHLVSPVISLPTSHQSQRSEGSFSLSSVEDFPPMETSVNSSVRRRGRVAERHTRRITPTPVKASVGSSFIPTPERSWNKSNPAFTRDFCSSDAPLPLHEERRLLLEQRRQWQGQPTYGDGKMGGLTSSSYRASPAIPRGPGFLGDSPSFSESSSYGSTRGQRRQLVTSSDLDSRISSHSIFSLSQSAEQGRLRKHHPSMPEHSSAYSDGKSTRRQPMVSAATSPPSMLSTSSRVTSPFTDVARLGPHTSTPRPPLPTKQVSLRNVSHAVELEALADVYARLIKERLVVNITSEIYFVIQLLTAKGPNLAGSQVSDESTDLFTGIDNCVYFAVCVLSRIKGLITALDKATLQLLAGNVRITELQPELAAYFAAVCESTEAQDSAQCRSWKEGMCVGVPFQEETDNSRNFPNIRAFHAFKKQRDCFYSILREWEKHCDRHNWSMQDALGEKIRMLVRQSSNVCSQGHLARLFQKQLSVSCGSSSAVTTNAANDSLVGTLRRTDPDKLLRLSERFLQPSRRGGPCPPPRFSQQEEFFTGFIQIADSYLFNYHLRMALHAELMKFHCKCGSVQPKDVTEILQTMRVLAKFLGFLDFLPYRHPVPEALLPARNAMAQLDVSQCVGEAVGRGHLCVTVPWVVDYLSMMDSQAPTVKHFSSALHSLMVIYRSLSLRSLSDGGDHVGRGVVLILTTLGWLFEKSSMISATLFENALKSMDELVPQEPAPASLDCQAIVTAELLYACCPYLGEIRCLLAEFAAGLQSRASPMRKITPMPADSSGVEESQRPARRLQIQLQENFFRSHPPHLKHLCDVIAERVGAKVIAHCEAHILPQHVLEGNLTLAQWIRAKCSGVQVPSLAESEEDLESFSQAEADTKLLQVSEDIILSVNEEVLSYIPGYCQSQCQRALEVLMDGETAKQVIASASSIAAMEASDACVRWATEKLRGIIHSELSRGFEKMKRATRSTLKGQGSDLADSISGGPQQECGHTSSTSPVEDFKRVVSSVVPGGGVGVLGVRQKLGAAVEGFTFYLESTCLLPPSAALPQLMPRDTAELQRLSVDLASILISRGWFLEKAPGPEGALLERLVGLWKVVRRLKVDFPAESLMSVSAFKRYMDQEEHLGASVWYSLASVITACLHGDIVSSPVVEALWLCRCKHWALDQDQRMLKAVTVYLDMWYSSTCATTGEFSEADPTPSPIIELREVHFVRLLTVLLQSCDLSGIPHSISSHAYLKNIIHPFD